MPFTGPLLGWLTIQLAALILAAARIRLWAQAPHTTELLSLRVLLVSQILTISLLFPILLREQSLSAAVVVTSWPFILLAGLLSAAYWPTVFWSCTFISGWLAALAIGQSPLCSTRARLTGISVVSLWALGGPVLRFVGAEYGGTAQSGAWEDVLSGPILAVNHLINGEKSSALRVLLTLITIVVVIGLHRRKIRRTKAQQVL